MGAVGYDPEVRVRFQTEASMDAEVMNPTTMLGVMRNPDVPVLQACSEVFNDWMAEFVSYDPQRLVGIGVIPMYDVAWAVEELNRTLNRGLNGPMINCQPPDGCPPYRDPVYDKFWAAAEEAGVPITLHILTGRVIDALFLARIGQTPEKTSANPGLWIDLFIEVQTVLANDFIYGGILDRFPNLKVLCSEFEVSWIPGFMARLDQIEDVAPRLNLPKLNMKASDYMKTRVFHGFIDDTAAELAIPYVGVDRILWGSDFPHIRSIGLDAQSTLYQQLQSFSEEDQAKLVGENAVKVFGLE